MARQTAIDQLSDEDRKWLDDQLLDNNFQGYAQLADELKQRGYQISKSSVHRHGQKIERRLQAVQDSTQAAIYMAEKMPDDAGALSNSVLNMMQTEFFNALVELQAIDDSNSEGGIDPMGRMLALAKAGKGIAEISKASVNQKKWQLEVREKTQNVADEVEKLSKKGGLSDETANLIRAKILGIAE